MPIRRSSGHFEPAYSPMMEPLQESRALNSIKLMLPSATRSSGTPQIEDKAGRTGIRYRVLQDASSGKLSAAAY